jgi:serine/threonine protein kinase
MGEVYRARDPRLGREVAIKVLPGDSSTDPERLRRFEQEAKAAGALNHPNLLAVFDTGQHDGAPFVVFCAERDAPNAPRREAPAVGLDYAIQIARGLAAAHEEDRPPRPEARLLLTREAASDPDFGSELRSTG